jgi:hypothetical protein
MPRHDNEEDNEDIIDENQDDALQDQAVLNLVFTEQQVEEYLARYEQEERELARQALEQRAHQILRERARANVRREIQEGNLAPRPPKSWGTFFYENGAYALHKARDFGEAYITVNTAYVGAGMLATAAICATKKGACVAACASQTATTAAATVAAVANPVAIGVGIGVGGAMLVGYGVHRYRQPAVVQAAPANVELGNQREAQRPPM